MSTKLEDALTELKADHSTEPATIQLIELVQAQNERIKNLEFHHLETRNRVAQVETTQHEHDQSIASLTKSRDETSTKVNTIVEKPARDDKRIDDLEKRVTTVEGAVGSKAFRKAEKDVAPKHEEAKPAWTPPAFVPSPGAPPAPAKPENVSV